MHIVKAGETPVWGMGAVHRWVALLDAAEASMSSASPHDQAAQRSASRQIDALFRYEHQLTPVARRRARELVWRRDRPHTPLPPIRGEWEACRCGVCAYERRTGKLSVLRRGACGRDRRVIASTAVDRQAV